MGDSFVLGVGDPECLGWTGRVARRALAAGHNVTSYNIGIRGETTHDIFRRWRAEVKRRLEGDFDGRVVFSFGLNDIANVDNGVTITIADTVHVAEKIVLESIKEYKTLWIGPPPVADPVRSRFIGRISKAFEKLAVSKKIKFLNVFDSLKRSKVWMAEVENNDGSHPGAEGYEEFARLVLAWPSWWYRLKSIPS